MMRIYFNKCFNMRTYNDLYHAPNISYSFYCVVSIVSSDWCACTNLTSEINLSIVLTV